MSTLNKNTFGHRLKSLRRDAGITQAEAATRTGVSTITLGKWERNEHLPKGVLLVRLASVLDTSPEYLLNGDQQGRKGRKKLMQIPVISWATAPQITPQRKVRLSEAIDWTLTAAMVSEDAFALRISDDSMQNPSGLPCIPINSIAIIEPNPDPDKNRVVLAFDAIRNCAVIRQYVEKDGSAILLPANPSYSPIDTKGGFTFIGIVKHVMYDVI